MNSNSVVLTNCEHLSRKGRRYFVGVGQEKRELHVLGSKESRALE